MALNGRFLYLCAIKKLHSLPTKTGLLSAIFHKHNLHLVLNDTTQLHNCCVRNRVPAEQLP